MAFRRGLFSASCALAVMIVAGFLNPVLGQDVPAVDIAMGPGSTIEVTGTGSALAPADGAIIQLVIYSTGGISYGIDEGVAVDESAATPGTFAPYPDEFLLQPTVNADQLQAITDSLELAGIAPEMIESRASDAIANGYFGTGSAVLAVQLGAKQLARIDELVEIARDTAVNLGLSIDQVNTAYQIHDCSEVNRSALSAAIADAQKEASLLADTLGVELGDVVKVTKQSPFEGLYLALLTSFSPCESEMTLDDAFSGNFTGFPANKDGLVEIYSAVVLTYNVAK